MDVEDPLHPLADDAALDLAQVFERAGVRGSFCITGEKCRVLAQRGRGDVVEALRPHCLGLHTDTHSRHPTTMELLESLPYEEGCAAAYEAERRGFASFQTVFGREPSFWGGAGNTWSPEINEALKRLGIPACAYALTRTPDGRVHRFNGIAAFPQHLSVSESEWADDALAALASRRVLGALRNRTGWTGVFVGHPTRFRFPTFWDGAFFAGKTPDTVEPLQPLAEGIYVRSKENLAAFLARLRCEAQVVGLDEAMPESERWRPANQAERRFFREETERALHEAARWPVHRPGLSADRIVAKTLALEDTLEIQRD